MNFMRRENTMTEPTTFAEARKKLEQYPTDTIDEHYSIFCVPLYHKLSGKKLKDHEAMTD